MHWTSARRGRQILPYVLILLVCGLLLSVIAKPARNRAEAFFPGNTIKLGEQMRIHNVAGPGQIFITAPEDMSNTKYLVKGAKLRFYNFRKLDSGDMRVFTKPEVTKTLIDDVKLDRPPYLLVEWDAKIEPDLLEDHMYCAIDVLVPPYLWTPAIAGTPVYIAALPGPWGNTNFPDPAAKVIWATPNSHQSAEAGKRYLFRAFLPNSSSTSITATIHGSVDNEASWVLVDSKGVRTAPIPFSSWAPPHQSSTSIPAGGAILEVTGINSGNAPSPAGLRMTVIDSNNRVLLRTDERWRFEAMTPVATPLVGEIAGYESVPHTENWGTNLATIGSVTAHACAVVCNKDPSCVGFTHSGSNPDTNGTCYPKKAIGHMFDPRKDHGYDMTWYKRKSN